MRRLAPGLLVALGLAALPSASCGDEKPPTLRGSGKTGDERRILLELYTSQR